MAMIEKGENRKQDCDGQPALFKHYKVMVKILQDKNVEYQNLEIFTTGLQQLLEMRRIHNRTFGDAAPHGVIETSRQN